MAAESKKKKDIAEKKIIDPAEKKKALDGAIKRIEKSFGKGSIMKLGKANEDMQVETTPTGSISLDIALGQGGIPKGRVIEIYGPESTGKTTIALHMVAEVQKAGGIAGFIDAEHALDPVYAKNIGVDIDELYISQPDSGEQGLEIAEAMVSSGAMDLLVIDSVAALVPKAEIQGLMSDLQVGAQARLMSKGLRKLTSIMSKFDCAVIFINQLRDNIGGYGPREITPGGRALKFYASVRIEVKRSEFIRVGTDTIGLRAKVKISKNKVAPPFKEAEFDIMFGQGISKEGELIDMAVEANIIDKSGAWYSYNGEKLGQGRENSKIKLKEDEKLFKEIEEKVRVKFKESNIKVKKKTKKSKDGDEELESTTIDDEYTYESEEDFFNDDIINDTNEDIDKVIDYVIGDEE